MTSRAEIASLILASWREESPRRFRAQPRNWLERQAEARASLAEDEMAAILMPMMTRDEAWSEVARFFVGKCPVKQDEEPSDA